MTQPGTQGNASLERAGRLRWVWCGGVFSAACCLLIHGLAAGRVACPLMRAWYPVPLVAIAAAMAYVLLLRGWLRLESAPLTRETESQLGRAHAPLYAAWATLAVYLLPSQNAAYLHALAPWLVLGLWAACLGWCVFTCAPHRKHAYLFLVILLFAAFLRLKGLTNQSLWNDELLSVTHADPGRTFGGVLRESDEHNYMPPGYFVLLWLWLKAWGSSEYTARLLSVLIGLGGIAAMYALGARLAKPSVGLVAAFLTAVNWSHLLHSQDARPYSLLFLLSAASYLAFLRLLERPKAKASLTQALVLTLLIYTHYFGWLVWLAQAAAWGYIAAGACAERRGPLVRAGVVGFLIPVAAYLPQLPQTLESFRATVYWVPKPQPAAFAEIFLYFFHDPAVALLVAAALLVLFLRQYTGNGVAEEPERGKHALGLLLCWLAVAYLVPYTHSLNAHVSVMLPRYFMVLLPALLLLCAIGIDVSRKTRSRVMLTAALGAFSLLDIFSASDYYHRPAIQEYRELVQGLPHDAETLFFARHRQTFKFEYYFRLQGARTRVHDADSETLRRLLKERFPRADAAFWLLENIEFYGVVNDPEVLRAIDQFMAQDQEITRAQVRARRYVVKPDAVEALRAWLQAAPG